MKVYSIKKTLFITKYSLNKKAKMQSDTAYN